MCGIAGILDEAGHSVVTRMLEAIAHRGPDDQGIWASSSGIILGHRRLSIIDTSDAGHQPMVSASGRHVLTYNGEIYNCVELREALEADGSSTAWRGHSDTEVLLAGFDTWGIEATLRRCNGMFAFAVWDQEQRALTLARDRMGEKPLYFGWVDGRFCFASELKALARAPGWSARMSGPAIATFLGAGHVRGPRSAVEGIYRLPPGTALTLSMHELGIPADWAAIEPRLSYYWSLHDAVVAGLSTPLDDDMAAVEWLETLLAEAIRLRMTADVPLGAFLSGGIDSSLVVALMQAQASAPVRTFSIGFADPAFDEAPHARAVARHLGTEHTELYVGAEDALALVPHLAETFDEPFADNSQIPTMLVSALARRQVTVALSGDAGDELFAGYGRYFDILRLWRGLRRLPSPLRGAVSPVLAVFSGSTRWLPGRRDLAFRLGRLSERMASTDLDSLRLSFIGGAGALKLRADNTAGNLHQYRVPAVLANPLQRLMYADQLDYLPDDILHKVDRASMAAGLEARVPFLDHRVVEFAWRLPPAMLFAKGGQGKQPLHRVLERHVPRALFERPKQGFSPPMAEWLRGPLREWAESLLAMDSLRELPMLDAGHVRNMWAAHQARRMDAGQSLWNVLMLADWRRRFHATL